MLERQQGSAVRPGVTPRSATTSDINPQDPATLQQGGNLRLALTEYPSNFNSLHIDGNVADAAAMLRATMPRAFQVTAPDGSTTVNTDYFTSVELTSENPQVVTYTINPKAVWTDGAPITWEDIASQINATSGKDKAFAIASPNGADRVDTVDPRCRRPPGGDHLRQAVRGVAGHVRRQHHAAAQEHDRGPRGVQQGSTRTAPARPPDRSSSRRWTAPHSESR